MSLQLKAAFEVKAAFHLLSRLHKENKSLRDTREISSLSTFGNVFPMLLKGVKHKHIYFLYLIFKCLRLLSETAHLTFLSYLIA